MIQHPLLLPILPEFDLELQFQLEIADARRPELRKLQLQQYQAPKEQEQ
jgi:hypothetical protein